MYNSTGLITIFSIIFTVFCYLDEYQVNQAQRKDVFCVKWAKF